MKIEATFDNEIVPSFPFPFILKIGGDLWIANSLTPDCKVHGTTIMRWEFMKVKHPGELYLIVSIEELLRCAHE